MKQKMLLETKEHKLVLTEYSDGLQLYVENGEENKAGIKLDVRLGYKLLDGLKEWLDEQPLKRAIDICKPKIGDLCKKSNEIDKKLDYSVELIWWNQRSLSEKDRLKDKYFPDKSFYDILTNVGYQILMFNKENPNDVTKSPRYEHDCSSCVYLGEYGKYDMYFCMSTGSAVARRGNDGADYTSCPCTLTSSSSMSVLSEIKRIATLRGLYDGDYAD